MTTSVTRPHNGTAHRYSLAALAARTMELAKALSVPVASLASAFWAEPGAPDPTRHHAVRRDAYMESAAMRREMHRL